MPPRKEVEGPGPADLAHANMIGPAEDINDTIQQAVKGLHVSGYSWAEIVMRLGVTRLVA